MTRGKKGLNFENSLAELESLVEELEEGELSLEDSLKAFERGIKLTRECQVALTRAEQKVQQLIEENGSVTSVAFEEADQQDHAE
jgi:exodeoxyribonuclease VII small subunit